MEKPITLCILLQHSIGDKIVVEFQDESVVEGIVSFCDNNWNIGLEQAVYYRRRLKNLKPFQTQFCFIRGSSIRFIHFKDCPTVLANLKSALRRK